ncbi:hypothetical protein FNYG_04100 [Fusarium nygamai]|uniref:Uncharacterized protein n=1 Tax=Gibberella nygamai TaxID=42673 RepID=A0A2K0WJD9_GIBNY|nr:hypothetical protein FNYG_04100 [Fusarium nygamai]
MFEGLAGLSFNENGGWTPVFHSRLQGICNLPCLFLTLLLQAWGKAFREIQCVEYIADGEQYWIPRVFLRDQRGIDLDLHPIINVDAHPEFEATNLYAESLAYAISLPLHPEPKIAAECLDCSANGSSISEIRGDSLGTLCYIRLLQRRTRYTGATLDARKMEYGQ